MTTVLSDLLMMGAQVNKGNFRDRAALEAYESAKKQLNEEARDKWGDESWHREQAALLAYQLDYGFTFDNLYSTYFVTKQVGEFERIWIKERTGMRVFYTHRGGYIEESQIKTDDFELPRDTLGFHVSEFEDKLRANFADSMEALVSLGLQRMEAEVNRRMFLLLQEAIPNTSPYYINATGVGGLTADILNTALRQVTDTLQPTGLPTLGPTILGRAVAVDRITDLVTAPGIFDPEALDEVRLRGRIGTYRGANLVRIQNYGDENGTPFIPDDEIWVFGGAVGMFVRYGGPQTYSWKENTVDYVHYRHRRDIGGLVFHPEMARRIKITP